MNPLRLTAKNYRTWAELDLALPEGCLAIVGANGAGKSSLLNLIDLALFGGRDLSRALTRGDEDTMVIALEFEHGGTMYRIRRTYSARGRGSTKVDFEVAMSVVVQGEGGFTWAPLTRETAAETQNAIEQTIGLSRETFRASAFLAQGDGAAFTNAQPRERKAILAEVLGLDLYDKLSDKAGADRRSAESELQKIAGALEVAEHELLDKPDVVKDRDDANLELDQARTTQGIWQEQLHELETQVATARENAARAEAALALVAERHASAQHAHALVVQYATEIAGTEQLLESKEQLQATAGSRPDLEQRQRALYERQQECLRLKAERENDASAQHEIDLERHRKIRERDELVEKAGATRQAAHNISGAEHANCPTCGQQVKDDALQSTLSSLAASAGEEEAKAGALNDVIVRLNERHDEYAARLALELPHEAAAPESLDAELQKARHAEQTLAAVGAHEERLPELQARLDDAIVARGLADEALKDAEAEAALVHIPSKSLDALLTAREKAAAALTHWAEQATLLERTVARCDERLERFALLEARIAEHANARNRLLREVDLLARLEKAFGRDGVPALIVENSAIPQLEAETNRIIGELGRAYTFELRTQRALKSGDGVRESLDIVIHDGGSEGLYEDFSGGERSRIDLALRISLARLLAHRRGADVRLLAIDEPDGLDAEGFEQLAGVLRSLTREFKRVIVVSHHPDLRDAFDQSITIAGGGSSGEPSRIVGVDEPVETVEVAA